MPTTSSPFFSILLSVDPADAMPVSQQIITIPRIAIKSTFFIISLLFWFIKNIWSQKRLTPHQSLDGRTDEAQGLVFAQVGGK
jgi:hypothetical protein